MHRALAPLIGIPLGLFIAGVAVWWARPLLPWPGASGVEAARPAGLPRVLPFALDPMAAPPGATVQATGTGFFAADHQVVTAAHLVSECRAIRLVSRHLPPTAARLVAVDVEHDIAVLHVAALAPARLDIGAGAHVPGQVLVYGFPAGATRDVPATTWAGVVNDSLAGDKLHRGAGLEMDPRTLVWTQARDIAQGYSGGPMLDPADGRVVGIVRAVIDRDRAAAAYGIATPDLSIGPGVAPLRAVLAQPQATAEDADDIFTRARKAVVRVYCWR